jgi:hypothetical protein
VTSSSATRGRDALNRRGDLGDDPLVALTFERGVVVPVRFGEPAELLVRPADVEEHVAVAHEPVGCEEVLERSFEVPCDEASSRDLKVQLGFVCEPVAARDRRSDRGSDEPQAERAAQALVSRKCHQRSSRS